jgi:hypothetical protein
LSRGFFGKCKMQTEKGQRGGGRQNHGWQNHKPLISRMARISGMENAECRMQNDKWFCKKCLQQKGHEENEGVDWIPKGRRSEEPQINTDGRGCRDWIPRARISEARTLNGNELGGRFLRPLSLHGRHAVRLFVHPPFSILGR